jgi:hypothetical protein
VITPQTQEDNTVNNVEIKFMEDDKIFGRILQLYSTNSRQVFIACPAMALDQSLGIRLPYGILLVKNMNKYFSLELGIRDHRRILRRFRLANYQVGYYSMIANNIINNWIIYIFIERSIGCG